MKKNSLFWALSWVAAGSLAIVQGCGGDDDDNGDDGAKGGKGGSSGSNTGGTATGGRGGSSGATGGGTAGTAGTTGGSAGTAPTGGTAGAAGAGGAPGGAGGAGGEGGGATTRGEVCVDYCSAYFANDCDSATTNPANSYTDQPTCEFVCANSAWALGEPGVVGNTVWCRLDHANNAAGTTMRTLHCGHASENSTGVCVP